MLGDMRPGELSESDCAVSFYEPGSAPPASVGPPGCGRGNVIGAGPGVAGAGSGAEQCIVLRCTCQVCGPVTHILCFGA